MNQSNLSDVSPDKVEKLPEEAGTGKTKVQAAIFAIDNNENDAIKFTCTLALFPSTHV